MYTYTKRQFIIYLWRSEFDVKGVGVGGGIAMNP